MRSSPRDTSLPDSFPKTVALLGIGDLLMLLLFVVIGRISHGMTSDWLVNVLRIATPFVLGWGVAAWAAGAYRPGLWLEPAHFLARSAAAWLPANGLAFLLRYFVMQDRVTLPFALTSVGFTGLFLLAWRLLFLLGQQMRHPRRIGTDSA